MTIHHTVRRLDAGQALDASGQLAEVLLDCVEGGASVSFMLPMARQTAVHFWQKVADGIALGERTLIVAEEEQGIVGTVQLITSQPENQPHRADVAKLLVHRRARKAGVGLLLMQAVEDAAREQGKTVLVLDTSNPGAERLYERLGWQRVGSVPNYALMPDGVLCATTFFYKAL